MGEKLLPDDRQKTEEESQAPLSSPSNAVAQSCRAYVSPIHKVEQFVKLIIYDCLPYFLVSAKFSRKIVYIPGLPSLAAELPMDQVCIPDRVKQ